jgi:hypothetical protein
MSDKKLDMDWVKSQIQAAKVRKPVGNAILKIVETVDELDISHEQKQQALEVAMKVALGHAVAMEENKEEVWTPVRPGNIRTSDQVRVKFDAFEGQVGTIHNGRRGVVVAVRYGDVIIKSNDGKKPELDGAHYPPSALEKLVVQ